MSIDRKISDIIFINGIYDDEKNKYGKRRESQTFFFNGKYYWADLNTFLDMETECMIFESDKRGKVTDWNEVYCRRNIDVTRENLLKCINEFKREMAGKCTSKIKISNEKLETLKEAKVKKRDGGKCMTTHSEYTETTWLIEYARAVKKYSDELARVFGNRVRELSFEFQDDTQLGKEVAKAFNAAVLTYGKDAFYK